MKGYARLALLMGDYPEVAIFRRFSVLSAQNLLYLQAELRDLEVDLRRYAEEDDNSAHRDRKVYSLDWFALKQSCEDFADEGNDGRQWQTVLALRSKLEEYQQSLLRHKELVATTGPMKRDLEFLNKWMHRTDMGDVYLHGQDNQTWANDEWRSDLLVLKPLPASDMFFRWAYDTWTHWYHRILGRHIKEPCTEEHLSGTMVYGEALVLASTRIVATTLACVLPVASIALLYTIQSMGTRIGVMAIFTALFSFSLVTMTSTGISDIFAATAAFAAVQVVFIGTSISPNCP